MSATFDQIEGGLWGLLVGDAAGVPYEFHSPDQLPPLAEIQMIPPDGFPRSYGHIPPGTWSDDGAQALCLAASLIDHPDFDTPDFARRLLDWSTKGYMAVGGKVFDIGIQTGAALNRLARGEPPATSGLSGERNNGNGSLMRSLPLALLYRGDDGSLVTLAHEQSSITHSHPRSQACCALYCLWARRELHGHRSPWDDAVETLRAIYQNDSPHMIELETRILPECRPSGTGYVVDALHSARHACESSDYAGIVQSAIALGNDTDTTACIAGGIAGIRHGKAGIPSTWRDSFRGKEILLPMLERIRRLIAESGGPWEP
jgi:ADP-ribosyl-[dinitrogen reductase] hydrolase